MRNPGETLSSSFQNLGGVTPPPPSHCLFSVLCICSLSRFNPFTAVLVRFLGEAEVYTLETIVVYPTAISCLQKQNPDFVKE